MRAIDITISRPIPLPLLRKPVPARFPSQADNFIEDEIDLQRLIIVNRPATFLVRVSGDSMIGKQLHCGDLAVVDRSLAPRTGDVVVATHALRLGEKLRRGSLGTDHVTVLFHTSEHDDGPQRSVSTVVTLPEATSDTLVLIKAAAWGLRRVWRDGFRYSSMRAPGRCVVSGVWRPPSRRERDVRV